MLEAPSAEASLTGEAAALASIFEGEDDLDLGFLLHLANDGDSPAPQESAGLGPISDEDLEALMRDHFSLPKLDVSAELKALEQGRAVVKQDDWAADDFSEEEWLIVRSLRNHVRKVIQPSIAETTRATEIEWCFMRGTEDKKGVSFHLACKSLRARPFVVQTLLQHYWYQRGIVIDKPFGFLYDPLPDPLQTEAMYHAGTEGLTIASIVWSQPSILASSLMGHATHSMPESRFRQVITYLEDSGILSIKVDRWYVTSRKPAFRKFRRQSWSASFLSDD